MDMKAYANSVLNITARAQLGRVVDAPRKTVAELEIADVPKLQRRFEFSMPDGAFRFMYYWAAKDLWVVCDTKRGPVFFSISFLNAYNKHRFDKAGVNSDVV